MPLPLTPCPSLRGCNGVAFSRFLLCRTPPREPLILRFFAVDPASSSCSSPARFRASRAAGCSAADNTCVCDRSAGICEAGGLASPTCGGTFSGGNILEPLAALLTPSRGGWGRKRGQPLVYAAGRRSMPQIFRGYERYPRQSQCGISRMR